MLAFCFSVSFLRKWNMKKKNPDLIVLLSRLQLRWVNSKERVECF